MLSTPSQIDFLSDLSTTNPEVGFLDKILHSSKGTISLKIQVEKAISFLLLITLQIFTRYAIYTQTLFIFFLFNETTTMIETTRPICQLPRRDKFALTASNDICICRRNCQAYLAVKQLAPVEE